MLFFIEFAREFNLEWMVIRLIAFKPMLRARIPFVERKKSHLTKKSFDERKKREQF
jgi:hypothetical protein